MEDQGRVTAPEDAGAGILSGAERGSEDFEAAASEGDYPDDSIMRPVPVDATDATKAEVSFDEDVGTDEEYDAEEDLDEEGLPDIPEAGMDPKEASTALEAMLSADAPPPPPRLRFNLGDLAQRLGRKKFEVEVRGLLEPEINEASERAIRAPTKEERQRGQLRPRDQGRYVRLLIEAALVEPDIHDKRLLAQYQTAENVIRAWFLPGEQDQLFDKITDLSGWGANAVESAKE